mmetsp:Transcript_7969/g.25602  ORF Transcript_7969/g.25602 Transcript_7969/m.25602 type:complete len:387 (-) Transcript_7969:1868-3028(-)
MQLLRVAPLDEDMDLVLLVVVVAIGLALLVALPAVGEPHLALAAEAREALGKLGVDRLDEVVEHRLPFILEVDNPLRLGADGAPGLVDARLDLLDLLAPILVLAHRGRVAHVGRRLGFQLGDLVLDLLHAVRQAVPHGLARLAARLGAVLVLRVARDGFELHLGRLLLGGGQHRHQRRGQPLGLLVQPVKFGGHLPDLLVDLLGVRLALGEERLGGAGRQPGASHAGHRRADFGRAGRHPRNLLERILVGFDQSLPEVRLLLVAVKAVDVGLLGLHLLLERAHARLHRPQPHKDIVELGPLREGRIHLDLILLHLVSHGLACSLPLLEHRLGRLQLGRELVLLLLVHGDREVVPQLLRNRGRGGHVLITVARAAEGVSAVWREDLD